MGITYTWNNTKTAPNPLGGQHVPEAHRMAAWITRNLIADDPNPEYSRLDRLDGLGKRRPTITAGCMDCGWQDAHHTTTAARASLEAHSFDQPGHRALISDDSGWHRVFGEWLADGPRISGGTLTKEIK